MTVYKLRLPEDFRLEDGDCAQIVTRQWEKTAGPVWVRCQRARADETRTRPSLICPKLQSMTLFSSRESVA